MALRFRKSFKIAPGVKFNIGKKVLVLVLATNLAACRLTPKQVSEREHPHLEPAHLIRPKLEGNLCVQKAYKRQTIKR